MKYEQHVITVFAKGEISSSSKSKIVYLCQSEILLQNRIIF